MTDANQPPLEDEDAPQYENGQVVGRISPWFSNATYDKLKALAMYYLPALAVLYLTIAPLWDLPRQEEVSGTIMAVDVFLGVLLGLAGRQYQEQTEGPTVGIMAVTKDETGKKKVDLQFPGDPLNVDQHDKVTFKVRKDY
jgi:hypothetical protein